MAEILKRAFLTAFMPVLLSAEFVVKSYHELRNENVVRQNYEESCGASSLATLINLIDINRLNELDVLEKMKDNNKTINTNMVSFNELKQTANKLNYEAHGYQLNRGLFNKLNIPILVKIQNDPRYPHFIIVINHVGDFVTVFDPSFGEYLSLKDDFFKLWDKDMQGGYALILASKSGIIREHRPNLPTNRALFDTSFLLY